MTIVPPGPLVSEARRTLPGSVRRAGTAVALEPLANVHINDMWEAVQGADTSWAYLKYGPFATKEDMSAHVARISDLKEQPFFAVIPRSSGEAEGWASICGSVPTHGAIELVMRSRIAQRHLDHLFLRFVQTMRDIKRFEIDLDAQA